MLATFENVGQISNNVREATNKLKILVPAILQEVECVTNSVKESIEIVGTAIDNMSFGVIDTVADFKKALLDLIHISIL